MALNSVGTETRRSVLLVLHDTSQPWITMAVDWQPKGLCPQINVDQTHGIVLP